jgi:hypothetical protein
MTDAESAGLANDLRPNSLNLERMVYDDWYC